MSRGDDYLPNGGSFSYSIDGDGLQLITDNLRVNGGDVIHGPYLISQNPVTLNTGDQLSFSWRGEVTDNAFDAYAYLLDADTGSTTELLDSTGNSTTGLSDFCSSLNIGIVKILSLTSNEAVCTAFSCTSIFSVASNLASCDLFCIVVFFIMYNTW